MHDETTNESNDEGKKVVKDVTPIERVTQNYEALKEANDKVERELLREEELKAKIALGGRSMAGTEHLTPEQEIEDKAKKEAEEIVDAFR